MRKKTLYKTCFAICCCCERDRIRNQPAKMSEHKKCISTTIKDSFFDDPFFKDWWNDFDFDAMDGYNKNFQRQISSKSRNIHFPA